MGIMHNGRTDKRAVMKRSMNRETPRDDLEGAFAGDENKGPADTPKEDSEHSTHVKSRKKDKSDSREKF